MRSWGSIAAFTSNAPEKEEGADVLVEATTDEHTTWIGSFRRPPPEVARTHSGIHSTPNPDRMCVVVSGDAYLIPVHDPQKYELAATGGPVLQVRAATHEGLLLLASPWVVTGVGSEGVRWQTTRLAVDGIRLDEIREGWVAGVADPEDEEPSDFVIDLRTGHHEGGAQLVATE